MYKAKKVDYELEHLYDGGSAFPVLRGDDPTRAASVTTREGTFEISPACYQTLLGALRYALQEIRKAQQESHSADKVARLQLMYSQVAEILVTFDW